MDCPAQAGNWLYIAPGGQRTKTRAAAASLERSGRAYERDLSDVVHEAAERATRRFPDGNYPAVRLRMAGFEARGARGCSTRRGGGAEGGDARGDDAPPRDAADAADAEREAAEPEAAGEGRGKKRKAKMGGLKASQERVTRVTRR